MGKLEVSLFSFDSRIDFQSGYVREVLYYQSQATLKDLLQCVNPQPFGYQEFGCDMDFIACRINGLAVFGNLHVKELVQKFGQSWVLDPLSKKYAKKDLLLNFEIALKNYQDFFATMNFLTPSECKELIKYLPINFIAPNYDDTYCGDGFLLYVKWLLTRYPLYRQQLLESISSPNGGIFEHIPLANFMFPANNAIDLQIESLQSYLLNHSKTFIKKEWTSFSNRILKQYGFTCYNSILPKSHNILSDYKIQNLFINN